MTSIMKTRRFYLTVKCHVTYTANVSTEGYKPNARRRLKPERREVKVLEVFDREG